MTMRETELVETLTSDGDEYPLSDNLKLRLLIEHDPHTTINDYDCYGKCSKYAYDYRDDGFRNRPDGFTGRARKIEVDRGLVMWWEPYDETYGWQDDAGEWHYGKWEQLPRDEMRRQINFITDLLREGFKAVGLRLMERVEDRLGHDHWVQVDTAWIGGVDDVSSANLPDLILDLTVELEGMPDAALT